MKRVTALRKPGGKIRAAALLLALAILCGGCGAQRVTPVARVDAEDDGAEKILAKAEAGVAPASLYGRVSTTERVVSIVLEGFTSEDNMRALADAVSERGIPAVFFLGYVDAADYPQTARHIAQRGCELGNYGLDGEKAMQNSTPLQNARAFYRAQSAIQLAAERTPAVFRCNGSVYTDELLRIAAASGLQAGVQPSEYLNHRSFSGYQSALNYVRKLPRGSIVSIKLGQELDEDEYAGVGDKLDERPAVDKEPTITNETLFRDDDIYANTLNVVSWLLDALEAEQFEVVSLSALAHAARMPPAVHALDERELALYDSANYSQPVTQGPLGTGASAAVGDGWFDGAVFVGDFTTQKLQAYVEAARELDPAFFGGARFLARQGLGAGNALWQLSEDSEHPAFEGEFMAIEDAIAAMGGVTSVYLMLGLNDIPYYDEAEFIDNYHTLIELIHGKTPDAQIRIQSITPGTAARTSAPANGDIFRYDLALARFCAEYGYAYIDVASALRDGAGSLPAALCSDPDGLGLQLSDGAVEIWIDYLRTHAS